VHSVLSLVPNPPVGLDVGQGSVICIISYRIFMDESSWRDEPDYLQCPVCDRVFKVGDPLVRMSGSERTMMELEAHIRTDHHMVKVRKGSNYRWVDAAEMAELAKQGPPLKKRVR